MQEICAACGQTGRWVLFTSVPDSSCVDGSRTLSACSPAHLADVQRVYAARPWSIEETWMARIRLTVDGAERSLSRPELGARAGLTPQQVDLAFGWYRTRLAQRLREMTGLAAAERRPGGRKRRPSAQLTRCPAVR